MTTVISVENLGKKYIIGHQRQQRYLTLRDTIAERVKEAGRRLLHPFLSSSGQPLIGLATTEEFWALKDVSFEIQQGERVGIIGRNGAGKTTLLKLLSRITEPTTGRFMIKGRVASLLEVGTGFHSELTGRENIHFNGAMLGMRKAEIDRRFDEIVDFSGVEKFIDTPVKRYSSGMYVRLAFAVAAHMETEILLVDEVLAVGDAEFQRKCLGKMRDAAKEGRTVLFVSHNMLTVENLCPRTIWIHEGRIRQDGSTRDVIRDYLSSSVPQDVGSDLRSAERYRGTGEIQLIRVELLDTLRRPLDVVRSGDSILLRLHYHAREVVAHPDFIVGIATELGVVVTQIATFLMGYQLPVLKPAVGYVDLEIAFLNLMPGRYYLSLAIWDQKSGRYYDDIRNRVALDVQASDLYQSGQGIEQRYGIVFLPCKWSFNG